MKIFGSKMNIFQFSTIRIENISYDEISLCCVQTYLKNRKGKELYPFNCSDNHNVKPVK